MTTSLIVVADPHSNSTVGLCKPLINLDDGGTYRASKSQRWLWNSWLDFWDNTPTADRTVGIFAGDFIEGDQKRFGNHQIITRNRATMLNMAIDILEPALDKLDAAYFLRGTPVHSGKSGYLEEMLAMDITIAVHNHNAASWWYMEHVCEGVKIFAVHHTSMGRLPWTFANAANRNAAEALFYYFKMKKDPPDLAFFAHNHLFANSGRGNYPTQVFHLPAWQLPTEFANRKKLGLADIGGMYITCKEGNYQWDAKIYQPPTNKIWKQKI